jgi:hypothetical protein
LTSNEPLELAFRYAQFTQRNIFLTGKAGTGKTTFLRRLKETTYKRMIVVAPTGVAAINAGGVTIHSFFQLSRAPFLPDGSGPVDTSGRKKYAFSKHKINILRSLDLLVIDEISMVRADLLDAIDDVLRRYQDRTRPFGGVQLLLIGDLQQLAPVTTDDEWPLLHRFYPTPYFFDSIALKKTAYTTIELTHIFRQADPTFVQILNDVRDGHPSPETLRILGQRYIPNFQPSDDEGYITLTTHNYQAQEINRDRMARIPSKAVQYKAKIQGDFPESSFPTDEVLELKVGAQVMFCKNDPTPEKRFFNGKIGRIVDLDKTTVTVECPNREGGRTERIEVSTLDWTNAKYVTDAQSGEIREEVSGVFIQIPLKPAWAITIHKSQGLTFDRAIINAGHAFSYGQVYVALSRCRTLEGLVLSTPITASVVTTDPSVTLYNQFMERNHPDAAQLLDDERRCVATILGDLFDFTAIDTRLRYFKRLCEEHLWRLYPNYVAGITEMESAVDHDLRDVGLRFRTQIEQLVPLAEDYEHNDALRERVNRAVFYYMRRTADLLGDFFTNGLPDIGNKQTEEQLTREFELLKADYDLKMALFLRCSTAGFSLRDYWETKAKATMQEIAPGKTGAKKWAGMTGKSKKTEGSAAKTSTAKAAPAADSNGSTPQAAFSDIQNPELYDHLRRWRNDKAADLDVLPYHIFSNAVLLAIVNAEPQTTAELLKIKGVGKKLVDKFGAEIIDMITR